MGVELNVCYFTRLRTYVTLFESPEETCRFKKKKAYVNRYIALCNPFSWFGNSFPRFVNSYSQISQSVLSICNSFPQFLHPTIRGNENEKFNSRELIAILENGLLKSRERIAIRENGLSNSRERINNP